MKKQPIRTVVDVRRRLAAIRENANDSEGAHAAEDTLFIDVLKAIANGAEDPRALARLALRSRTIKFARWYA